MKLNNYARETFRKNKKKKEQRQNQKKIPFCLFSLSRNSFNSRGEVDEERRSAKFFLRNSCVRTWITEFHEDDNALSARAREHAHARTRPMNKINPTLSDNVIQRI